jgi:hypothetical protein
MVEGLKIQLEKLYLVKRDHVEVTEVVENTTKVSLVGHCSYFVSGIPTMKAQPD